MKRSRVNEILREADSYIRSFGYVMPPFAYLSPNEMKARRADLSTIVERQVISAETLESAGDPAMTAGARP